MCPAAAAYGNAADLAERRVDLYSAFRRAICVRRRCGRPIVREEIFGMPRIKPEHERCVFFLLKNGEPGATGFFVARMTMRRTSAHFYGITNHHAAQASPGETTIAVNTKAGRRRPIPAEDHDWHWSIQDDLSAIDLTDSLTADDEFSYLSEGSVVTKPFMERAGIAIGDEVFLVGLFIPEAGKDRNIASGRFGSLSILASDDAPVRGYDGYPARPRFVADMRSRPGYSGSPVFVYRSAFVDLRAFTDDDTYSVDYGTLGPAEPTFDTFVRFLGVHCAQYNEPTMVSKESPHIPGLRWFFLAL
jgi:hypothetical protein